MAEARVQKGEREDGVSRLWEALHPSRETLLVALLGSAAPIAIADETFRITFSNVAFTALTFGVLQEDELSALASEESREQDGLAGEKKSFSFETSARGTQISFAFRATLDKQWVISAAPAQSIPTAEHRDNLTGLHTRNFLKSELQKRCSPLEITPFALLFLDLDRFKGVNDTLGHAIGDRLLCRVTERLQSVLAEEDLLVRLGGDEFAILQPASSQPKAANALAERLVDLVGRSYIVDEYLINIGLSVGIAVAPSDGGTPEDLLRCADLALYRAKEEGRDRFRFFEAEMGDKARMRRALELDLRKALALREFEVHYQPQVGLGEHKIIGFEALIRWRHPERGMISPADFIPIAEENGLIVQIGEWVLRTACAEASNWPNDMKVAVNLSPRQFSKGNLAATVTSVLASTGLDPARLELEITESTLIGDFKEALQVLNQLKALGVRIAMDDFGTGYSSLSYLRSFPFDKVKIDQSFVREMANDRSAENIVKAVLRLGESLGMATTAEGVETKEQLEQLRAHGCLDIQGYFISRPIPASSIAELLAALPPGHPSLDLIA